MTELKKVQKRDSFVRNINNAVNAGISDADILGKISADNAESPISKSIAKAKADGLSDRKILEGVFHQNKLNAREQVLSDGGLASSKRRFERTGKAEAGFLGTAGRTIVNAPLSLSLGLMEGAEQTISKGLGHAFIWDKEKKRQVFDALDADKPEFHTKFTGKVEAPRSVLDATGKTLETALLVGTGGLASVGKQAIKTGGKAILGQAAKGSGKQLAKQGALLGAGEGFAQGLQAENPSFLGVAGSTGIGLGIGGVAAPLLPLAGRTTRGVINVATDPVRRTLTPLAKGLKSAGSKIQSIALKPGRFGEKLGYKAEFQQKYGIFGDAESIINQARIALKPRLQQLDNAIAETQKLQKTIQVQDLFKDTVGSLSRKAQGKGLVTVGREAKENAITKVADDFKKAFGDDYLRAELDMTELINLKRQYGKYANWNFDKSVSDVVNETNAVYRKMYESLKKQTEKMAKGTKFEQVNKEIHELISMERVAQRRLPSEAQAPITNLSENILAAGALSSGNMAGLIPVVANRLGRSPRLAKALVNAGIGVEEFIESTIKIFSDINPFQSGAKSQQVQPLRKVR